MVKQNLMRGILFLAIVTHLSSLGENIIFDLNGVLFKTNKMYVAGHAGIFSLAWTALTTGQNPRSYFFDILNGIEPFTHTEIKACDDKGIELPGLMCDWLKGVPTKTIMTRIIKNIGPDHCLCNLARTLFDPDVMVKSQKLVRRGVSFVQKCKKQGHSVFVLSNWDSESFRLIQKLYPDFWRLFDGILISGDCGLIKPDTKIYRHFLKEFKLNPATCFFLDNQIENIEAAQKVGIKGTLVKASLTGKPKYKQVTKDVNAWLRSHSSKKLIA